MQSKWLYEKTSDNTSRFILGEDGTNPLVCVGINPSTAEPNNLDRTLTNVRTFAKINGYDGWLMLNVYPQRATNPNDLHRDMNADLHQENVRQIAEYLSRYENVDLWAAWGTLIAKRKYLKQVLFDIANALDDIAVRWVRIGKIGKAGHPHHPLYLKHSSPIEAFDMEGYLESLG